MALQFVLPMLLSMATSGIGSALEAGTATSANRRDAEIMKARRALLDRERSRIREGGREFGASLDEQANRDFSRAADQIGAQAASTGMTNAGRGGQDALQAEVLGSILASLAQAKQQDDIERQRVMLELLNDPAYASADPSAFNVAQDALLGGVGGVASGAANTLASFMGTEMGMGMLMEMLGGGAQLSNKQESFGNKAGGLSLDLSRWRERENSPAQNRASMTPNIMFNPVFGGGASSYGRYTGSPRYTP